MSDKEVKKVTRLIPAEDTYRFITEDLGLSEEFLSEICKRFDNDKNLIMYESILRWRNKLENSGQNAVEFLNVLLQVCLFVFPKHSYN